MTFQLSPGVTVREIDKSAVIPNIATTVAGFVGDFRWGPAEQLISISDENALLNKFGKPSSTKYLDFLIAAQFLSYSNTLRVVRAIDSSAAKNASAEATTGSGTAGTGLLVKNDSIYNLSYANGEGNVGMFISKYAGTFGNGIVVSLADSTSYVKEFTVDTTGTALVGTGFTAGLEVGSKVLNPATGEWRTVVTVTDNTNAVLDTAFTADLDDDVIEVYWKYYDLFQLAPSTSVFASEAGAIGDELHVVIIDGSGNFTGKVGTVLERYEFVSKAFDAKLDNGASNYYKAVINARSKYVRWMDHHTLGSNWGQVAAASLTYVGLGRSFSYSLAGGEDGTVTAGDYNLGYDLFLTPEADDVSLLITGSANSAKALHVIGIAESTRNAIAFISPELTDVVDNVGDEKDDIIEFRNTLTSSSFAFMDSGWKLTYDKYNDTYRWLPLNGDIAGLVARSDASRAAWVSPAGFNRGNLKNSIKLAYNPIETDRDSLYANGINPVVVFPGEGTVLYGDKTLLNRPSAFDRINVRRLFTIVQKRISRAARSFLFEQNTASERARFKNLIEQYLSTVQTQQGIEDYRVIIDENNNTTDIIAGNTLVGDIYIKPTYSINYILLTFTAVRTGVEFSEVINSNQ